MSGLGGQEHKKELRTFQVPLPGSVDGIVDKVREIILKGDVDSISIKQGEPITYQRTTADEVDVAEIGETSFVGLTLAEIVRNIHMEEFSDPGVMGLPPQSKFFWMFYYMEHEGWCPTYMLLGEASLFWNWIGIGNKRGKKLSSFMGLQIERDKTIPSDIFLLCGAKSKNAIITEVEYVLKGNMEETK